MSDLSSLLGAEMAREAAGSRDGFDPASLLDATRRGARGKRRTRATLQALGTVAIVGLTGSAAWLTLGNLGDTGPGIDPGPTPSPSASPSASPTATPSPSPSPSPSEPDTTAEPWNVPRDEFGLPIAPRADEAVLAQVGPGWVLATYASGTAAQEAGLYRAAIYLLDADGGFWEVGRVDIDSWVEVWRPERHEVVLWGWPQSSVLNLVTGELTPFGQVNEYYNYLGPLRDGRETWQYFDSAESPALKGIEIYTPGNAEPDISFSRPDVPTGLVWRVFEDHLVALPNEGLGGDQGGNSVWEVYLDGSAVERHLSLPPGLDYCTEYWEEMPGTLVWSCSAGGEGKPTSTWILPLDASPAVAVDPPPSFIDLQDRVVIRLPGVDGLNPLDDPTQDDRPLYAYPFELPYWPI